MICTIATHDGRFHADDVLAIAALLMLHPDAEIIRTRDKAVLASCDLRVDVGGKNSPATGDFDHHQPGGAGTRANGIEYSSLGLVWREYGLQIAGDAETACFVDDVLIQAVDARDNGQDLSVATVCVEGTPRFNGVMPYEFADAIDVFNPCWDEEGRHPDDCFRKAVAFARKALSRLIQRGQSMERAKETVRTAVALAEDPRLIILDRGCPWQSVVIKEAPDALFVVMPDTAPKWRVQCVPKDFGTFENRKSLPDAWRNLDQAAFADATGVADAFFVHRNLFICSAMSREGALALAKLALAA